jgi:hypothetical protein
MDELGAATPRCRFCAAPLRDTFVDLGTSPLCQRHVTPAQYNHAESIYPLQSYVCRECFLVQLPAYVAREEIFSSYSDTMLEHARKYAETQTSRWGLGSSSLVVELASNDGYLLQYFVQSGVPVLGIEPTANTARVAETKGVRTLIRFFGVETARQLVDYGLPDDLQGGGKPLRADLLLGNNVLAHVPDINDFVGGIKLLLASSGVITMEFPQLLHLIRENYWDTIYHEHYSYLSFTTVERIFAHHGLTLFDVDEIDTHGGSIRIYGRHTEDQSKPVTERVAAMKQHERAAGHGDLEYYRRYAERVKEHKRQILDFLIAVKRAGKQVVAYGAPGKGNTLLNFCGIRTDFVDYTVDRSPVKQGNFLPGSRIPILSPERIKETKPDFVFVLVWNLKDEVMKQMSFVRDWGGKFVIPMPELEVV